ncbi:transcriptional regulator, TetR family [Eubacterium ruminantium]|nr:transcriptional regulator, TetR family [Eubacterium ruminantium]
MAESILTKQAIARSLKELSLVKGFDKISIGEISQNCNINRQTFYYHFQDKYALLKWIYMNELLIPNMSELNFDNWSEKLLNAMQIMVLDKAFYTNTIRHAGEYITQYLMENTKFLFVKAIDALDQRSTISEDERDFFAKFFSYGLCGMVVEWVHGGMVIDPYVMTEYMEKLLSSCETAAYKYKTGALNPSAQN